MSHLSKTPIIFRNGYLRSENGPLNHPQQISALRCRIPRTPLRVDPDPNLPEFCLFLFFAEFYFLTVLIFWIKSSEFCWFLFFGNITKLLIIRTPLKTKILTRISEMFQVLIINLKLPKFSKTVLIIIFRFPKFPRFLLLICKEFPKISGFIIMRNSGAPMFFTENTYIFKMVGANSKKFHLRRCHFTDVFYRKYVFFSKCWVLIKKSPAAPSFLIIKFELF